MWWYTRYPPDILFKDFCFKICVIFYFLINFQLYCQIYIQLDMKNILLLLDVWMQNVHNLNSYKPCITYNSNISTYSLYILLL